MEARERLGRQYPCPRRSFWTAAIQLICFLQFRFCRLHAALSGQKIKSSEVYTITLCNFVAPTRSVL